MLLALLLQTLMLTNPATTVAPINPDATVVSLYPPHPIDHQMICDIKAIASWLATIAHQLLGM